MLLFFVHSFMPKHFTLKILSVSLFATLCMLGIYVLLNTYLDGSIWYGMKVSKSAFEVEYCELNQTNKLFHQTMNTYSNLIYFFLGCIVVLYSFYDRMNAKVNTVSLLQAYPSLSLLFGICMIYLCLGSTFFHASMTWVGQRADMNGAYGIGIILFAIGIYKRFHVSFNTPYKRRMYIFAIVLCIIFFLQVHVWVPIYILLPSLLTLIIIITTINYRANKKNMNSSILLLCVLCTAAAALFRVLDVKKVNCDPVSLYQGHSMWHLFIGTSAFTLYWFYRSEKV